MQDQITEARIEYQAIKLAGADLREKIVRLIESFAEQYGMDCEQDVERIEGALGMLIHAASGPAYRRSMR